MLFTGNPLIDRFVYLTALQEYESHNFTLYSHHEFEKKLRDHLIDFIDKV